MLLSRLLIAAALGLSVSASADWLSPACSELQHGGGLNACGCHFNRKTGGLATVTNLGAADALAGPLVATSFKDCPQFFPGGKSPMVPAAPISYAELVRRSGMTLLPSDAAGTVRR